VEGPRKQALAVGVDKPTRLLAWEVTAIDDWKIPAGGPRDESPQAVSLAER
jgi:hypothetical protein